MPPSSNPTTWPGWASPAIEVALSILISLPSQYVKVPGQGSYARTILAIRAASSVQSISPSSFLTRDVNVAWLSVLRRCLNLAGCPAGQGIDQEICAHVEQPSSQYRPRFFLVYGDSLLRKYWPAVHSLVELHDRHPGLIVAVEDGRDDRRGTAIERKKGRVNVQAPQRRDFERLTRQEQAIRRDDHDLRGQRRQRRALVLRAQRLGLPYLNPSLLGEPFRRRWDELPSPARGPIRLRVDGGDIVSLASMQATLSAGTAKSRRVPMNTILMKGRVTWRRVGDRLGLRQAQGERDSSSCVPVLLCLADDVDADGLAPCGEEAL